VVVGTEGLDVELAVTVGRSEHTATVPGAAGTLGAVPVATDGAPLLVIDGDCGVCTRLGRWAQRRLDVARVEPWQTLDLPPLGLDEAACRDAVQYLDAEGRVRSAEQAVAAVLREGPWWARPAGMVLGWPLVRSIAAVVYRVVARNRHRLPGATVSCAVDDRTAGR
jgi:predicted DCC family thiol-disulfide oxidoreductase YuxK